MISREQRIARFLAAAGWAEARSAPLAGDASNRRYLRLTRPDANGRAVLMDAPPATGEDVRPFIHIARYLSAGGFSAPQILSADEENGLLLLEDLGDALYARVVQDHPEKENCLYSSATSLLAQLHRQRQPAGLAPYSPAVMTEFSGYAFDWYLRHSAAPSEVSDARFRTAMNAALTRHAPDTDVMIQRDYHAENLLWLPERSGVARVGLLDFQDAMMGHRAYDLVSLLQDARRDVPGPVQAAMLAHYISETGVEPEAFTTAYHCLGAQRNLRIIGVFARLCLRDGKPHYVDLIPRVWAHLQHDLDHPALRDVARIVRATLPEPTPDLLQKLKSKCATIPAL